MGSMSSNKASNQATNTSEAASSSQGYNQATGSGSSFGTTGAQSSQGIYGPQAGALNALYGQAQQLLGGQSAMGQQAGGISQAAQKSWLDSLTPGGNPYFSQNVQASIDQASEAFRRQVLPELDSRGAGNSQYGSSRDSLARGEAAGLFGQGLAQSTAQQYSQQYGADQALRGQAIGQAGNLQQSVYSPLTQAAGLIGGPTVLGQSSSQGVQGSQNASQSSGWQQAISQALSQGQSSGRSSGSSLGIAGK